MPFFHRRERPLLFHLICRQIVQSACMNYLLFPGRHLVNTVFQANYLLRAVSDVKSLPGVPGKRSIPSSPYTLVFAITSANQENSRYNPIPFHIRAIGVDRFARDLQAQMPFRYLIYGIPHYGHTTTSPSSR